MFEKISGSGKREIFHRYAAIFFLSVIAFSLPVSLFLLSSGMIGLAANWLLEGRFAEKWERLKGNPALGWFLLIYPVHLLWLLNTSDFVFGMHDVRIKLPLLVMPLVIGSSRPLSRSGLRTVFYFFLLGCLLATILAIFRYTGILYTKNQDVRNISGSLSHIRLALMINLCVFLLWDLAGDKDIKRIRMILLILAAWFLAFLFFLKSMTGIVVFILVLIFLALRYRSIIRKPLFKALFWVAIILVPSFLTAYGYYAVKKFYSLHLPPEGPLEKKTRDGNDYWHDPSSKAIENGFPVNLYICEKELRTAWNVRSSISYDSLDRLHQPLRSTLIRYLASKGLRKDQEGVKALTQEDISHIESGMANCIYANRLGIYPYVYRIIWEIHDYRTGGNPSGHSITQRLEYYRTAWYIFRKNPWFGTGTGDVAVSFKQAYEEMHSVLLPEWRLRAHNQFLTFLLTFGMIGFFIVLAAMLMPVILLWKKLDFTDLAFLIIAALSMINEDTLETHAGVSFVAFFMALLIFGRDKKERTS